MKNTVQGTNTMSIQCEQNSRVQQRVQQCAISYLWKPHYCGQLSPHLCILIGTTMLDQLNFNKI